MNKNNFIEQIYDNSTYDGDFTKKYAISAFRFYSRLGKPSYFEAKNCIYDFALEKSKEELVGFFGGGHISRPTEQAIINAEKALEQMEGKLKDILAVEKTLSIISKGKNAAHLLKCIEEVYFTQPLEALNKGEISNRVTAVSLQIPASDRQVYRWLRMAVNIFCIERGLRY